MMYMRFSHLKLARIMYVVNIPAKTCTCYRWQKSGIPCAHALSVSLNRKEQPETYTQHFYHLDAYRATYANAIFPPNADDATATYTVQDDRDAESDSESESESDSDSDSGDNLLPPNTRRAPGRPKKRRIRGATEGGDCTRKNEFFAVGAATKRHTQGVRVERLSRNTI